MIRQVPYLDKVRQVYILYCLALMVVCRVHSNKHNTMLLMV